MQTEYYISSISHFFSNPDVLTVNTNQNITPPSQPVRQLWYVVSVQFHDSSIDCEFI